jgi:hypothetical protein
MSEWWTYTPGDFLMFSARSYQRLVERYNADVWPLHLLTMAAGLAALAVALRSRSSSARRLVIVLLGAAWLWVAWAFLQRRFATINWAAEYAGWVFVAEGLALLYVGLAPGWRGDSDGRPRKPAAAGVAIVCFALLGYPLIALAMGRPWLQAEVFGVMPDPTAAATLGFLLLGAPLWRWLIAIPLGACIGGGAMLLTMHSAEGWLPLLIGASAAWSACSRGRRR